MAKVQARDIMLVYEQITEQIGPSYGLVEKARNLEKYDPAVTMHLVTPLTQCSSWC